MLSGAFPLGQVGEEVLLLMSAHPGLRGPGEPWGARDPRSTPDPGGSLPDLSSDSFAGASWRAVRGGLG